jgi:drug/metabolite transporter (DMT)-like permease
MPSTKRPIASVVLGLVALALFVRGFAYYAGSGPHDGEDLPSFATFVAATAVLFVAILIWSSARPRRRRVSVVALSISGVLLVVASAWWFLNVMLERWAS